VSARHPVVLADPHRARPVKVALTPLEHEPAIVGPRWGTCAHCGGKTVRGWTIVPTRQLVDGCGTCGVVVPVRGPS